MLRAIAPLYSWTSISEKCSVNRTSAASACPTMNSEHLPRPGAARTRDTSGSTSRPLSTRGPNSLGSLAAAMGGAERRRSRVRIASYCHRSSGRASRVRPLTWIVTTTISCLSASRSPRGHAWRCTEYGLPRFSQNSSAKCGTNGARSSTRHREALRHPGHVRRKCVKWGHAHRTRRPRRQRLL